VTRKLVFFGVALLFFGALALPSQAQELVKLKVPLTKLAPVQTTKLMGTFGGHWVKLPIPERWQIEKATSIFLT
jgi:hypothetical protein